MVNAFRAGTIVAVVAALVGWFMVLRAQSFAGHTLSIVGFPGAAGAVGLGGAAGFGFFALLAPPPGVSASFGFFAFCTAAALVIAVLPRSTGPALSEESAVIGTVQAFALACGLL